MLQSFSDYSPQQVISPLDGSAITVYNVSGAKLAQVQYLDTNAPNRKQWYNGFEFGFNARLGHGAQLQGGVSGGKNKNTQRNARPASSPGIARGTSTR